MLGLIHLGIFFIPPILPLPLCLSITLTPQGQRYSKGGTWGQWPWEQSDGFMVQFKFWLEKFTIFFLMFKFFTHFFLNFMSFSLIKIFLFLSFNSKFEFLVPKTPISGYYMFYSFFGLFCHSVSWFKKFVSEVNLRWVRWMNQEDNVVII